jgi:hypothetical protein
MDSGIHYRQAAIEEMSQANGVAQLYDYMFLLT